MGIETYSLAQKLAESLIRNGARVVTAESCTGGMISSALTDLPGSSAWFHQGFVTYSNKAKSTMLGVSEASLETHGAVSERVVSEMLAGALSQTDAEYGVSVSGIAGPSGGSDEKPVGTVWLAWGSKTEMISEKYLFRGNRSNIRHQAVCQALRNLIALLN